jgi:hypothetical protein
MLDAQFSLEIADAYEQLGALQDKTSGGKDRQAALATYYKAADILTGISPANADSATVRAQLDRLNQRIASMGGSPVEVAHGVDPEKKSPSADSPTGVVKAAKIPVRPTPQRTGTTADANQSTPVSDPPAPPPQAPAPSTIAPAELRELERRVSDVTASIDSAEQAVQPYRDSLAAKGQTLTPDLIATMTRMHAALDRANRDISDGDAAAAKEDLAAAAALTTKVLHAIGR